VSIDYANQADKADTRQHYLTGTQALAQLPLLQHQRDQAAGLNTAGFISGYRGSPLGNLDKTLWQQRAQLKDNHIHFQPGVNEELAATAVWGSQQVNLFEGARYDGVFGLWYGKGPGVDRSGDVIKHGNSAGVSPHGGVLLLAGDDHACKSSSIAHQSEHAFIGAMVPVLNPCGVQEILDYGVLGWALSRYSGCWVALKTIAETVDSSAVVEVSPQRVQVRYPTDFEMPEGGVHIRWPDPPLVQEKRLNTFKIYAALAFARANSLNRVVLDSPHPRIGIITTGKSYLDVLQALEYLGLDENTCARIGLRVLKIGMSWPLEPVAVHEFAKGLDEILVVEEKRSIIEDQVTGQLYNWPVDERPRVVGEFDEAGASLLPNLSELTPAMIARVIAKRIAPLYAGPRVEQRLKFLADKEDYLSHRGEVIQRPPHFCSGCPHNTSTKVPEGSRAMAGIGCHYMAMWMDRSTETFTQMGGEGASWIGQAPFTDTPHVFQNLGDGTYFHSGILAIRAAVAANVNITYKLLYNDAVAMTGGQPIDGTLTVQQLSQQLYGEGIRCILLVSDEPDKYPSRADFAPGTRLHHRRELDALQRELREIKGVSAIIYDQTCATEKRRRRKRGKLIDPAKRVLINPAVCEGCGDCGVQSNCLSILPLETELGRKRQIDQNACNKDFSCVEGFCPSFVTVKGGTLRKAGPRTSDDSDFADLPEPVPPSLERPFNILLPGIGGTGVTTVGALLGTAAFLDGKGATVLDQAGLAQKFGPVTTHVRIAARQDDIHAVRIAAGEANLLLGFDLVVAASDEVLGKLSTDLSHAVINSHASPTAEFTRNRDFSFPGESMGEAIKIAAGADQCRFVDGTQLASSLLGDSLATNLFMLGFAWQQGLVPLSASAIEQAIETNRVAIEMNKGAFLWGRRAAWKQDSVEALVNQRQTPAPTSRTLDELVDWRADFLVSYQDRAYANRYRQAVQRVRRFEEGLGCSDADLPLTRAVAENYFRLLACKDEYEVARLYTDGAFLARLESQFEGDYRLEFHLAPPILNKRDPHTGLPRKRQFGPWMLRAFGLLAKLKGLRGTAFDLFGYTDERRAERALISDYEQLMDELIARNSSDNHDIAVALARLPEQIRGFGHIKEKAMVQARTEHKRLRALLNARQIPVQQLGA
jgi:indolepyruvate ferredoxin oxidoreductase